MIAGEALVDAGHGREIGRRRADRLHARLFVVGDDRHRLARLLRARSARLLEQRNLAVDAQHLGHLLLELGVAALEVVAHLVRLHRVPVEQLAHRALGQPGKAGMARRRTVFARVPRQQLRRPQLMRIAEVLGLAAGQIDQPGARLPGDLRRPSRSRAVVQGRGHAMAQRPIDAALHRLMVNTERPADGEKRRVVAVAQQHARALHSARRFPPRPGHPPQPRNLVVADPQIHTPPRRRHDRSPRPYPAQAYQIW